MNLTVSSRLKLQLGDITTMTVDAVVNSTDPTLAAGGPVHVAIHRAAGPELLAEVAKLEECPPGQARLTSGHHLAAPFIIHTVAPTWMDGKEGEARILASCYRECLKLAAAERIKTLAFPSLGSGPMPQIPLEVAAPVAIGTILDFLREHEFPKEVVLVCFTIPTYQIHQKILKEAMP
jgi:O-acetyl-ADP-ribose deacetylase (regulator of RNase III)